MWYLIDDERSDSAGTVENLMLKRCAAIAAGSAELTQYSSVIDTWPAASERFAG